MPERLFERQSRFFRALNDAHAVPDGLRTNDGFEVYRSAYRLRIEDAIDDDFALSLRLLEPAERSALWARFFAEPRSDRRSLNEIGAVWLEFLRGESSRLPPGWLALAEFEWARYTAHYLPRGERRIALDADRALILTLPLEVLFAEFPLVRMFEDQRLLPAEPSAALVFWADGTRHAAVPPAVARFAQTLQQADHFDQVEAALSRTEASEAAQTAETAMKTLAALGLVRLTPAG